MGPALFAWSCFLPSSTDKGCVDDVDGNFFWRNGEMKGNCSIERVGEWRKARWGGKNGRAVLEGSPVGGNGKDFPKTSFRQTGHEAAGDALCWAAGMSFIKRLGGFPVRSFAALHVAVRSAGKSRNTTQVEEKEGQNDYVERSLLHHRFSMFRHFIQPNC